MHVPVLMHTMHNMTNGQTCIVTHKLVIEKATQKLAVVLGKSTFKSDSIL